MSNACQELWRSLLVLFGNCRIIGMVACNDQVAKRFTALEWRLGESTPFLAFRANHRLYYRRSNDFPDGRCQESRYYRYYKTIL